jgi:DNA-binding NarL/FixJ family response regulator
MTSRPITGITDKFKEVVPVTIFTSSHDIRSYLEDRISGLPSGIALSPTLQEEIKNRITQAAGGMYVAPCISC